jgi:hypothetical protein
MNDAPHQDQVISDDQELANVLSGMQQQAQTLTPAAEPAAASSEPQTDLHYEEINTANAPTTPAPSEPIATPGVNTSSTSQDVSSDVSISDGALSEIKRQALEELRPLATKLDLPPEEKFDALLLIIRSTDDHSLIGTAYEAAKSIDSEDRRAQALFDIVKEIDYFASKEVK